MLVSMWLVLPMSLHVLATGGPTAVQRDSASGHDGAVSQRHHRGTHSNDTIVRCSQDGSDSTRLLTAAFNKSNKREGTTSPFTTNAKTRTKIHNAFKIIQAHKDRSLRGMQPTPHQMEEEGDDKS